MLIACTAFTACNSDESSLPIAGNQLKLSFGIKAPESRAIFTDTKLPDGKPVGVRLDGYADYANLVYTGTTTSGTQSWTSTTDVTLTDTKGTLYAYWPQNNAVSIDAIDVDMTAADQTDWLYATPVTDVNEDKASVAVTMNHALANINVTVNKGSYLGAGNITNITVQSDGIALGGTFNAAQTTPGYTAFEDEGKPLSRTVSTTTGAAATDIMVVPTGTSAAITFLLTIDGIQFTAKSDAVQLAMGNSYQYTLKLSDISTYMEISGFAVKPWTSTTGGTLDLEEYDPLVKYADWIQAIIYIDETEVTSRSTGVEVPILSTSSSFDINSIQMIAVDGVQIEPSINYTFNTPGRHVIHYLPVDVSYIPKYLFYNLTTLVEVKIPQTVISIGRLAFYQCTGLTEVTIPNSVTTIEGSAFIQCTGLTEVTIPELVTSIGESAFEGCSGITSINICNGVKKIEQNAFGGCTGIVEIVIPESVTSLGNSVFPKTLNKITSLATTAPTITSSTFYDIKSRGTLIVPSGCTDAYASWMSTGNYYLGKYNWTIQEMTE